MSVDERAKDEKADPKMVRMRERYPKVAAAMLEAEVDVRLRELWLEFADFEFPLTQEQVFTFIRSAYSHGYIDSLREGGEFYHRHGYEFPKRHGKPHE